MDKRGMSLDSLYPAILTIVLVGILIGLGVYILIQTGNSISTDTLKVTNETITNLSTSGNEVSAADDCGAHSFTGAILVNGSSISGAIPTSNYSFSSTGEVVVVSGSVWSGNAVNITYTYTGNRDNSTTSSCAVMSTTGDGVGGLSNWIAVIVVVLAAAIVISIVIGSFVGQKSSA